MFENITSEKQNHIAKALVAFLVVVTAFFVVKGINEIKRNAYIDDQTPAQNTISVSGEGEVFEVPDTAEFTFTVQEEAASVAKAQESVTQRNDEMISFLKDNGVKEEDIKTTRYNIAPRYEYRETTGFPRPPRGERTLVGYEVSQTNRVRVEDTDAVGTLLGGLGEKGVSEVSGVSFTIDDAQKLHEQARKKAIDQAKEKARTLADQLGVSLGDVVSFDESGNEPRFRYESVKAEAGDAAGEPNISPGENRIISNVNITYEIR